MGGSEGRSREAFVTTYFSIDVETDGPIPGPHSMLSLGCVAFDENGEELSDYSVNFRPLFGSHPHPDTSAWWEKHRDAWDAATLNPVAPLYAMREFDYWVRLTTWQQEVP